MPSITPSSLPSRFLPEWFRATHLVTLAAHADVKGPPKSNKTVTNFPLQVSGAPVVSDSGELIANLSISDLRALTSEHFGVLALPVAEFLAVGGRVVRDD